MKCVGVRENGDGSANDSYQNCASATEVAVIQSYRDLRVWQTAMDLAVEVYRLTSTFPVDERYGLTAQLRRAAVSIASNIGEGHGRTTRGEYLQHLSLARGSAVEVEVQLTISERLGYLGAADLERARDFTGAICRMITNLKRALEKDGNAREGKSGVVPAVTRCPRCDALLALPPSRFRLPASAESTSSPQTNAHLPPPDRLA
jgi:four helix bundle protein